MIIPSFLQLNIDIAGEAQTQMLPFSGEGATGFYVSRILTALMAIAAVIVLIALVTGALDWINSGGDKSKIEKARERMTQAIIGLVVFASVLAIFTLVQNFLGISIFRFTSGSTGPSRPVDTNPRTGPSFSE